MESRVWRVELEGKQLVIDIEWTRERIKPNEEINRIRNKVSIWRKDSNRNTNKGGSVQ